MITAQEALDRAFDLSKFYRLRAPLVRAFAMIESDINHAYPPRSGQVDVGLFQLNPRYFEYTNDVKPTDGRIPYGDVINDWSLMNRYLADALQQMRVANIRGVGLLSSGNIKWSLDGITYVCYNHGPSGAVSFISKYPDPFTLILKDTEASLRGKWGRITRIYHMNGLQLSIDE